MRKIIFLVTFFTIANLLSAQEKAVVRISNAKQADFINLTKKNYDIASYKPGFYLDVVIETENINKLEAEGYSVTVVQTEAQAKENMVAGKSLAGYRTYSDLLTDLQTIEANNPSICKLYDIGDSRGREYTLGGNSTYSNFNHEIWAMKISDNVATEEDEPSVFYMAEHHAREPISLEVNMYVMNYLVSNYGTDPDVTNWIDNTQIWFTPLVNPNGHKIVTDETDLWWRKNIRDNNANGQLDDDSYDGVDPNRNYGWNFGGTGSSSSPGSDTYHGPNAFSEPEILAMKNMVESHHFVTGITYHSYSELVLYPYGYDLNRIAPDNDALAELAVEMANTIPAAGGGYYTPQISAALYAASGVTDDYTYGQHGIFTYTIELGTEFIPPASQIAQISQDNLQAALILLDRVNHSTLTGLVTDVSTGLPVVAEVYIDGIDNTGEFREPYTSDVDFGRYFRLLTDGNYTVTFSAYGYFPQTFTNVNINNLNQTILNVSMVATQQVTVTGTVTDMATGLPIENANVEATGSPLPPVQTDQYGNYSLVNLNEGTYTIRVSAIDYATISEVKNVTVSNHVFDFQLEESQAWSFETGSFEPQWTQGGNALWFVTTDNAYDGTYCSKSGSIGDNSTSEMSITLFLNSGGDVSFFRKVSSEANYDYLKFYIDGSFQGQWAGETAWSEVSFPVTSGQHTFKWVYAKDANTIGGSDCAWVDFIIFPPLAPLPDNQDIDVDLTPIEVFVPIDSQYNSELAIANLGDLDLTYSIAKQYGLAKAVTACAASGGCDEYISRVVFNTINNTSTCDGYADYTSISTDVDAGSSYDLTIENGSIYGSDDLGVWIDWNIDGDFDDVGENVVCESGNSGQGTFSITVPNDAVSGNTIMRIRIKYYGSDCGSPCGTTQYGEVEDYSLTVHGLNDWLSISPISGTIAGSGNTLIGLSFNSTDLAEGDYQANIVINSNDPDEPQLSIPVTMHVTNTVSFDLKAMVEGPFNTSSMGTDLNADGFIPNNQPFTAAPWNYLGAEQVSAMPNANVVDWILVELRDATDAASANPATRISRQAAFILNDGSIVGLDGSSGLQFSNLSFQKVFVVVYHRNHLGIISSEALPATGNIFTYDFTTENKSYGVGSQNELSTGIWGMISGDANADGTINDLDKSASWNSEAGKSGYLNSDLNNDGEADNKDKTDFWLPNMGKGSQVPQ
ncbi:MAG: hypothetical protein GXO89_17475 [Chlorobi bacterium]|nr:hypothetical protein [Chlorobiota bacterium]